MRSVICLIDDWEKLVLETKTASFVIGKLVFSFFDVVDFVVSVTFRCRLQNKLTTKTNVFFQVRLQIEQGKNKNMAITVKIFL